MMTACQLAIKHRDYKLALLLSQATCGDANFKQMAYEQMDMWRRMGVSVYTTVPTMIRRLEMKPHLLVCH